MTKTEMSVLFSKHSETEQGRFENIPKKRKLSNRKDLTAFLILDKYLTKLNHQHNNIISATGHDEFYLDVEIEELAEIITEEDILDLVRCGIRYDRSYDCLCKFV